MTFENVCKWVGFALLALAAVQLFVPSLRIPVVDGNTALTAIIGGLLALAPDAQKLIPSS